jgi:prevent-host-death family protein
MKAEYDFSKMKSRKSPYAASLKLDTSPNKDYIQSMSYQAHIKPISYLKANAAQVLRDLAHDQKPMVITQNGEAAAVLQDMRSFEKTQETMALLKILALGNAQIDKGQVVTAGQAFAKVRRVSKAAA